MPTLQQRYETVQHRIQHAAEQHGRDPAEISLLAVSKTKPAADIQALAGWGQQPFGENYLDEAVAKQAELAGLPIEWHFIGALQSNKTRIAAERMDWVQTVDRLKIGRRLHEQRPADRPALNVLVQVNISAEPQKAGVAVEALPVLLRELAALDRLRVRGLMAIPAAATTFEAQRVPLDALKRLFDQHRDHYGFDTLSMGMSGDLDAAIASGSTLVRVGRALFGARD